MNPPLRIWAILDTAHRPAWWVTTDNGKTYTSTYGERITVEAGRLSLLGHGLNDPAEAAQFPKSRRVAFQAPRSYDG
jgi:hypothetical protein